MPRVYETGVMGPAGTSLFGIDAGNYPSLRDCFLCVTNGLLAFRPWVVDSSQADGCAFPASFPATVKASTDPAPTFHLIPELFCVMAVPFYHLRKRGDQTDAFYLGFDADWMGQFRELLKVVPGLDPRAPFSFHAQYGKVAGARPQGFEKHLHQANQPQHGFMRITYGRELLREVEVIDPPQVGMQISTRNLGLDTILHQSRAAVGALPDHQTLWDLWEPLANEPDGYQRYNSAVLASMA